MGATTLSVLSDDFWRPWLFHVEVIGGSMNTENKNERNFNLCSLFLFLSRFMFISYSLFFFYPATIKTHTHKERALTLVFSKLGQ